MGFEKEPTKIEDRQCCIILHGIPEANSVTPASVMEHNRREWMSIHRKLGTTVPSILAKRVSRIPRPPHLNYIKEPRLLRITLLDSTMVSNFLDTWDTAKNAFPAYVKCHRDRPRDQRRIERAEDRTKLLQNLLVPIPLLTKTKLIPQPSVHVDLSALTSLNSSNASKNGGTPTLTQSA